MTFSQYYDIKTTTKDDWFDPILLLDTKLFIDPLLISERVHPNFKNGYVEIAEFFSEAFKIAANCAVRNDRDIKYRTLLKILLFPEVNELNLGYSKTTHGSGAGKGFAKKIAQGIFNSIDLGLKDINRFENIGLFSEGIGRDRISDITANILKKYFISYTQQIAKRHKITMKQFPIRNYSFNYRLARWEPAIVELPENPFKNEGVILCPSKFINDYPFISKDHFLDFIWERKNEEIRDEFSLDIKSSINKEDIIRIARNNLQWVEEFNQFSLTRRLDGYDVNKDVRGLYSTLKESFTYANNNPRVLNADNLKSFDLFVESVIDVYADYIENNSGYKLLWNDNGKSRNEEAAQLTFIGIVKHYCKSNDIYLGKEVNLGRGPVDFTFSKGYKNRASMEVKLARNSHFWNGIRLQLPKYMEVEDVKRGYFLVICYTDEDLDKMEGLTKVAKKVSKEIGREIIPYVIDATKGKPSASKLKK